MDINPFIDRDGFKAVQFSILHPIDLPLTNIIKNVSIILTGCYIDHPLTDFIKQVSIDFLTGYHWSPFNRYH